MDDNEYLSVGELTKIIKMKFDNSPFFNKIYIKGEISNFKRQLPSGHCYFSIKDESSKINAVMFSQDSSKLTFEPKDGDSIYIIGKISVYEPNGNYQLYVKEMNLNGAGELYKKFLELKEQLFKEGYFDDNKKKPIPKYPKRIGIITASTGAAIRDILSTIKRRYPICETILFPSLVQGGEAAADLVRKIINAEEYKIDTLIIGRGGGSLEDLWPFNERIVADAIHNCTIPVISAVGHQTDFTIADFVADLRAATPTAAAELAVPNIEDIFQLIDSYTNKASTTIKNKITNYKLIISKIKTSYIMKNPMAIYEVKQNNIKNVIEKINTIITSIITFKKTEVFRLQNSYILTNPNFLYDRKKEILNKYIEKLEILNPMNALKRGYAILKKDNKSIDSVKMLNAKDNVDIKLGDGTINANIINIKEEI